MMKEGKIFIGLSILLSIESLAQKRVSGIVADNIFKKPVPYATVINTRTGSGVFSTESGRFNLSINGGDNLKISCVGFDSVLVGTQTFIDGDTVFLVRSAQVLPEVKLEQVDWNDYKEKKLGFSDKRSNWHTGGKSGQEYAIRVDNEHDAVSYITTLLYKVRKRGKDTMAVRLHLYAVAPNGLPGEDLLDSNFIELVKGPVDEVIAYDVSHLRILFPKNGVFVAWEWLGKYDNNINIIINSRAMDPSIGLNEKTTGITLTRENGGQWSKADVRMYFLNTDIEKKAFSKDPPNASFGITVMRPR